MPGSRRIGLAGYAAFIAFSAYAGAVGLATGWLDTGHTIASRMPFASPVLGGLALMLVVAVPTSAVAWFAARGDTRCGPAAVLAGTLLIGWIVVEVAFIRELSWLQPFYVAVGASLVVVGRRRHPHRQPVAVSRR